MAFHRSETSLLKLASDPFGFAEVCGSIPRSGAAVVEVVVVVGVVEVVVGGGTEVVATADVTAEPQETVATDRTRRSMNLRPLK